MKRVLFKSLLAIVCLLGSTSVSAYDFEVNGIAYDIISFSNLECAVAAGDNPYLGDIEIPSTVSFNGKELTVVSIGANAFRNNAELISVVIPETVITLGTSCFEGCTNLTTIIMNDGVKEIGLSAFKECSSLEQLVLSNTTTTIGASAFQDCVGLKEIGNTQSVQMIDTKAFSGCRELLHVDIPNVSVIEESTFDGCTSLAKIELCDYLTQIKDNAFRQCGFEEFVIPNTVNTIGKNILSDCQELRSFTIGNGIMEITSNPIEGCDSLQKLIIADGTEELGLFHPETRKISEQRGTVYIYKYMLTGAFSNLPIDYAYIGRPIRDDYKYYYSDRYPQSESYYYSMFPFHSNTHLKSIVFGPLFTIAPLKSNYSGWLEDCSSLESIEFEAPVDKIPSRFASGATSLSKIEIPNSVTLIENQAFLNCTSLETVYLGSKLTQIGSSVFTGCDNLSSIYCKGVTPPSYSTGFTNDIYLYCQLYIPLGASSNYKSNSPWNNFWNITEDADCIAEFTIDNIKYEVVSGNSIKVVGNTIVETTELIIPEMVEYHSISYNVIGIADNSFENCKKLTSITIPKTVTSIGNDAFNGCSSLQSVFIEESNSPLTLGYQTKLTLSSTYPYPNPETVEQARTGFRNGFYDGLFSGLPVEQLVINRDIRLSKYYERTYGTSTTNYPIVYNDIVYYPPFINLSNLKSIEIGRNVNAICEDTINAVQSTMPVTLIYNNFGECKNIEVVVSRNPKAPVGGIFAQSVYNNGYLFLPNGGESSYRGNEYWKEFLNIQETEFVPIDSIRFENSEVILDYNENRQLIIHIYPENASIPSLKWKSSSSFVDVDPAGIATSYSTGVKATITATTTDGTNISATCTVAVVKGSGIDDAVSNEQTAEEIKRHDAAGREIEGYHKGLNIIKMSDGTTKKVMVK